MISKHEQSTANRDRFRQTGPIQPSLGRNREIHWEPKVQIDVVSVWPIEDVRSARNVLHAEIRHPGQPNNCETVSPTRKRTW